MTGRFRIFWGHTGLRQALAECPERQAVRVPHHTSAVPSLLGALRPARQSETRFILQPGELLLAGSGVLILDDLAEFKFSTIVDIARAWRNGYVLLHARGRMIEVAVHCDVFATSLACACGHAGEEKLSPCKCTPGMLRRWEERVTRACGAFREGIEDYDDPDPERQGQDQYIRELDSRRKARKGINES